MDERRTALGQNGAGLGAYPSPTLGQVVRHGVFTLHTTLPRAMRPVTRLCRGWLSPCGRHLDLLIARRFGRLQTPSQRRLSYRRP